MQPYSRTGSKVVKKERKIRRDSSKSRVGDSERKAILREAKRRSEPDYV